MVVVPWLLAWAGLALLPRPADTFTLRVSIAANPAGQPVAQEAWLTQQVAQAQELFAPFGVAFARQDAPPLATAAEHVETRGDRDALAERVQPHVVNVFVVGSLRDVDEPDRMRKGVHWHAPAGRHYVIVVAAAPPSVLAHELGHFFGNPHSPVRDNVMSYERSGAPVFFDAAQGKRIAARAKEYVASGELSVFTPGR